MRLLALTLLTAAALTGCQAGWPGGPWGVAALALALLTWLGFARGQEVPDAAADASPGDAGVDQGPGAEPEAPLTTQVCLCAAHEDATEAPALPSAAPALDAEAIRARVLARLPADVVDRLRPPTA
ncbi:MAG: hypothetical protein H6706_07190 [Myxococcales bacterium]|nr:hypothetical protein [Myxococcales bacterium]